MILPFSPVRLFLSSNTQDFIEVNQARQPADHSNRFLSSNTQDFIEVMLNIDMMVIGSLEFLSSNTQDFIEVIPFRP